MTVSHPTCQPSIVDNLRDAAVVKSFGILPSRKLYTEAADRIEALEDFAAWVETWTGNPAGAYSVSALDGLFGMTRDRLAAIAKDRK